MNSAAAVAQTLFPPLDDLFYEAHRRLKPRTPVPEIHAEFFPFAGLNHTARLHDGKLRVRVSDIFRDAPTEVIRSLASILLAKLYRKKLDQSVHFVYRGYILRDEIQERARLARRERGRGPRQTNASGRHVDLEQSFDRLNRHYFGGILERPRLCWSVRRSRYVLGRYDALHNAICISRIFDAPTVPGYVIDYIMFHEMLHMKHRSRIEDSRCIVHTPEFRSEERRFSGYAAAKLWLKSL